MNNFYELKINDTPLLTREEEKSLLRAAKNGDADAKEKLIIANLRLVYHIAKEYILHNTILELDDIVDEGIIGLTEAIDNYSLDTNNKFSTYATYWIKKEISKSLELYNRTIRLPTHTIRGVKSVIKTQEELENTLNRTPTNKEIADSLKITEAKVEEYLSYKDDIISIDATIKNDKTTTILDMQTTRKNETPSSILIKKEEKDNLQSIFNKVLTAREKDIINKHLGLTTNGEVKTLQEIGKSYNLSKERIRQIESKAYKKLQAVDGLKEELYEINR